MIEQLAYDEHPSSIALDSIGIGAGVVDQLVQHEVQGLRPINVGSGPLNPGGKIQIESKDELKRRLRRSPDRADMLALLFDSSGEWLPANAHESRIESPAKLLKAEMKGW
jgi:hypothetical protein